jgi:ATP-dependent DNA helicase RecG
LLLHLPRDYQDRSNLKKLAEVTEGEEVTVCGTVIKSRNVALRGRMSMAVIDIQDETGTLGATFFGRGFLAHALRPGTRLMLSGRAENYKGLALKNPEHEIMPENEDDLLNTGRIVPIYRLTDKVSQRLMRTWMAAALAATGGVPDAIPPTLRAQHGFPEAGAALHTVHFPDSLEEAATARRRFAYEELLTMQTAILLERAARHAEETGQIHPVAGPLLDRLRDALPFALTAGQERAIEDIFADLASPRPMRRLLQGDVGCGKTIVALHAIAAVAGGGAQCALMAPTEVLAEQHYRGMRILLDKLGVEVALLTGAMRGAKAVRERIARGEAAVVVGTHALIQEATTFARLGLVIVDEQHRFGVDQRNRLLEKGLQPDVLHMTATPIPRTLAITAYGGMDITVIDELPPGRHPVKTRRVPDTKIPGLYTYIHEQARAGFQTYLVCPLVEESEARDLKSAIAHYEELSVGPLGGLRTGLLHGRLDSREKESVLQAFQAGEIDVLFSTTVIEVGIDVPRATTMVIEDAQNFGLTQLHQLRGRVGRGGDLSHCFLLGPANTEESKERMRILCETNSGFDIAEADLEMRGAGEFFGTRQSGLTDLRVADLVRDARLLDQARRDACVILEHDKTLSRPEHAHLREGVCRYSGCPV